MAGPAAHRPSFSTQPAGVGERNRRVTAYRELVRPLALHYARSSGHCAEDLVQVGLMGLIRAAERFRDDRGIPFEPFARPHVRGAILHYLRDTAPAVRLPRRQEELRLRFRRLRSQGLAAAGRQTEEMLCCRELGIDREQLRRLELWDDLRRLEQLEPEQWDQIAMPAERSERPQRGDAQLARQLLTRLEPRTRWVVARVVLCGWSYRRAAARLRVSPMTIQRLLQRGLASLRSALDEQGLSPQGRESGRAPSGSPGC